MFIKQNTDTNFYKKFRNTKNRIAQTNRQIERSLRSVVKVNSEQIKLPITDEEKSLQLLARQQ